MTDKNHALTDKDRDDIQTYLGTLGPQLTVEMRQNFIAVCEQFGLNPYLREIYGQLRKDNQTNTTKLSIIVGYEVYLKRAERTGLLDGWEKGCQGSAKNGDLKAWIKIYRKDWSKPFFHEVYFEEYVQNTYIWKGKPKTMIQKVVIAQGFRMAFPEHFGGMPYTSEEMPPDFVPAAMKTPEDGENNKSAKAAEKKPAEKKPVEKKPVESKPARDINADLKVMDATGEFSKFLISKKWLQDGQTVENLNADEVMTLSNNWENVIGHYRSWAATQKKAEPAPTKEEPAGDPEPDTSKPPVPPGESVYDDLVDEIAEGGEK